jgi:hypothetical protein
MKKTEKNNFDGHPEKPLSEMTPKEKLEYLSECIVLKDYIRKNVMRKERIRAFHE